MPRGRLHRRWRCRPGLSPAMEDAILVLGATAASVVGVLVFLGGR